MRIIAFIITLFLLNRAHAQLAEKVQMIEIVVLEGDAAHSLYSKENVKKQFGASPLKGAFRFYKKFISSQDNNSCSFHPSCSVYAMECVRENGLIKGTLGTFDRLSRCHGFAPEYYPIHDGTKKLYDPVTIK